MHSQNHLTNCWRTSRYWLHRLFAMENRQRQGISLISGRIGSDKLKIFVDADACPVVKIVEQVAKKHEIPCTLLCDTNPLMNSDYSEVVIVGNEADAADFKLMSLIKKGDICVTQDYGVAAMILGKGAVMI